MICRMSTIIPTVAEVKESLTALNHAQLQGLADASGVPFPTLMKIRQGSTSNPGLLTVGKFYPVLPKKAKTVKVNRAKAVQS